MTPVPALRLASEGGDALTRALDRAAGCRPIPGNEVISLVDGPAIFEAGLAAIAGATRWIHVDNYIFRGDHTGRRFADALARRAREGVRVRLLVDWLGSFGTPNSFWTMLRAAGIEVRHFGPPRILDLAQNLTRNHRKLIIADGVVALTGGFCIGDEWAGDPRTGTLPWRETGVLVRGPAAAQLDLAFAGPWRATGGNIPPHETPGDVPASGSSVVRVVAGEPWRLRAFRTLELMLALSARRIWLTDAYFVAPRRVRDALHAAAREGVDVRILVPGASDLPVVRNLTRTGYRSLLRHGVRVFEWQGPMLHAKSAVVDGRWVRIGSSNVNASSFLGNWEIDVLIEDGPLAEQMERQFRRDLDQSAEVVRHAHGPETLGRLQPVTLSVDAVDPNVLPSHRPSGRERRRRALQTLWAVAAGTRWSVLVPASVTAFGVGALFLFLPRTMAVVFGVLFLWLALGAAFAAIHRPDVS